jgi:hypothetical protein
MYEASNITFGLMKYKTNPDTSWIWAVNMDHRAATRFNCFVFPVLPAEFIDSIIASIKNINSTQRKME